MSYAAPLSNPTPLHNLSVPNMPHFQETYSTTLSSISGYRITDCFTTLKPIISSHRALGKQSIDRFETRFKKFTRSNVIFRNLEFPTIEGPGGHGDWVALCLPNALPARILPVAFFAAWCYRFDDMAESMIATDAHMTLYADILAILRYNIEHSSTKDGRLAVLARLYHSEPLHAGNQCRQDMHECLQQAINELLDLDTELGMKVLEAMMLYYQVTDKKGLDDFKTMEEYIAYRLVDYGSSVKLALLSYALNIHIPATSLLALSSLITTAMTASVLANDYYSFRKEALQSRTHNLRDPFLNAVNLLLRPDPSLLGQTSPNSNLSVDAALSQVQALALRHEQEFLETYKKHKFWDAWGSPAPTEGKSFMQIIEEDEECLRFVDGLYHFVAGNNLWSAKCRRYHGDVNLWNREQQQRHRRAISAHAGTVDPSFGRAMMGRRRGMSFGQGGVGINQSPSGRMRSSTFGHSLEGISPGFGFHSPGQSYGRGQMGPQFGHGFPGTTFPFPQRWPLGSPPSGWAMNIVQTTTSCSPVRHVSPGQQFGENIGNPVRPSSGVRGYHVKSNSVGHFGR